MSKDEHVLYTKEDFTEEEINRRNVLAVKVIEQGLSVCKQCGEYEAGLDNPCKSRVKRIEKERKNKEAKKDD